MFEICLITFDSWIRSSFPLIHSNWTKDDYEKLSVGTQADLLKGTRLSEVVENTQKLASLIKK